MPAAPARSPPTRSTVSGCILDAARGRGLRTGRDSQGFSSASAKPGFLYAALDAIAFAAFAKESRKKRAGATKLHRNSGKRMTRAEIFSRSAKALLPPHKCGGSHRETNREPIL